MNIAVEEVDYKLCKIEWYAEASMKDMNVPLEGGWVGDPLPGATVAGVIRAFREQRLEVQHRAEMLSKAGAVGGSARTRFGFEELSIIAARDDVPK